MSSYDDIIGLEHPVSKKRVQMPKLTRAAQFAPFAALTGYEGVIRETERLTESEIELAEGSIEQLDKKLRKIFVQIDQHPEVTFKCFQRDLYKQGGSYVYITGRVKRMDEAGRGILLTDGSRIPLSCIYDIK